MPCASPLPGFRRLLACRPWRAERHCTRSGAPRPTPGTSGCEEATWAEGAASIVWRPPSLQQPGQRQAPSRRTRRERLLNDPVPRCSDAAACGRASTPRCGGRRMPARQHRSRSDRSPLSLWFVACQFPRSLSAQSTVRPPTQWHLRHSGPMSPGAAKYSLGAPSICHRLSRVVSPCSSSPSPVPGLIGRRCTST